MIFLTVVPTYYLPNFTKRTHEHFENAVERGVYVYCPLSHLTFHIVVQSLPGWCCVVLFHKYPFKAKSKARNGTWLYLEQYSIKVKRDFILWSSRRNEHLYQLHYLSKNGNAFWRCVCDQPIRVQVTCCLFLYMLKTMC